MKLRSSDCVVQGATEGCIYIIYNVVIIKKINMQENKSIDLREGKLG